MKKSVLALMASALITGTIVSCQSAGDKVENAKENVIDAKDNLNEATDEYVHEIDAYKQEMQKEIAANDKMIADLEAKMEKDKKAVDPKYKESVANIKTTNEKLKEKIQNYKAEGKEAWHTFKAEFSHDMKELGNAFKDIGVNNVK